MRAPRSPARERQIQHRRGHIVPAAIYGAARAQHDYRPHARGVHLFEQRPLAGGQIQTLSVAALGEPGDDYPVTHARHHRNLLIVTDVKTATAPKFNI